LLIRGGRIDAVFVDESAPSPGDDVASLDLRGGYILPGFVDTHIHLTSIALRVGRCDLSAARSADDLCQLLAQWAREADTRTVMGVEWDERGWENPTRPTRAMLDAIDSVRPVLARRICGHVGVANTVLLDRLVSHPRFVNRENGLLLEHALWEAGKICEPPPEVMRGGMGAAIRSLHRLGITAIHDIVEPTKLETYLRALNDSRLPLRIDALLHTHPQELETYQSLCGGMDPDFFRLAGVKCFLDGSLGGETAALNEPYEGSKKGRGTLLLEKDELESIVRASHSGGHVCAMHAIGDRAIDQALDALADVPGDAQNFRIEHCEIVGAKQLDRLGRCPVFLALQPNFVRKWGKTGGSYERRLGKKRFRSSNPFRTLRQAGIPYVFGSDGMPPGPLYGLTGATRHPVAEERLSPEEAIAYYTTEPNRIGLHTRDAGVLETGRLADLVVVDDNPLQADLDRVNVTRTIIGGRLVFDASEE
jgi:predicted amidohydrolase YtcJ